MASPVPPHSPRKATSQDISSRVLSKISSTNAKALNADLAASWLAELDEGILESKTKIHELIHGDLPLLEHQLVSSTAVQERLIVLTANVDELSDAVSHPEQGIISSLLRALSAHATLAQQTQDTETTYDAMEHLLRCRKEYDSLVSLANEGRLADSVRASTRLQGLLDASPPALTEAEAFSHLKAAFRTVNDRVEEQLNDAYARSLVLSEQELVIRPAVQVRDSTTVLSLSSILSSLSPTSLSNHITVLRRDINTHYVDDSSGISSQTLSVHPSPCASENYPRKTLCKPVTTALLQQFLVSLLPSSLSALPPYLHLVTQAKELEETYIIGMLGQDPRDCEIKSWTDAVSSHYERRRRAQILEDARHMILRQDDGTQVLVEVDSPSPQPSSAPATQSSGSGSEGAGDVSDDAWGLEGEGMDTDDVVSAAEEEDAWGFDDDTLIESEPATDDSAWGWDDGGEEANPPVTTSPPTSSDNSADWDDDPWGDSSNPPPLPSTPAPAPKPASRLEKLASKSKPKPTQPHSPPPFTDPHTVAARSPPPATAERKEPIGSNNVTLPVKKELPKSVPQAETYVISGRARQLADTVDAILLEGEEFASTAIFDSSESTAHQTRGSVILQTAPAVLDLFRALYPVKFSQQPTEPKSIVFANDCVYTRGRVLSAAGQCVPGAKDRLLETAVSLEATGKRWYEQSIDTQQALVADTLKKAEGFVGTAEQEHYDECEEAVMGVLSQVRKVARQWKGVLSKLKYFNALGSLVNFCLTCVMGDILALPDITEVESHRLSELCRILHALEGLFVDDPEQPSFVVGCVPAWLKFSYLSELLEASMADISYLFDEGALVDFEKQELIKLVRALFADTPQRANMINKLMAGHAHSP
ncbi:hypothetical protein BC826DRAFT_1031931 [Russula brevipes]|nr:hypothetical protein BC826DRAFT_1031931 [Russula brevipes]